MKTQIESLVSLPSKREHGVLSSSRGAGGDWSASSLFGLYSKHSSFKYFRIHLHCCLLLTKLSKFSQWHNYTIISLNTTEQAPWAPFSCSQCKLLPIRALWRYFWPFFKWDFETFGEQRTHRWMLKKKCVKSILNEKLTLITSSSICWTIGTSFP